MKEFKSRLVQELEEESDQVLKDKTLKIQQLTEKIKVAKDAIKGEQKKRLNLEDRLEDLGRERLQLSLQLNSKAD